MSIYPLGQHEEMSIIMDNEIWKPIPGYEEFYEVSDLGRVKRIKGGKSTKAGKVLKGYIDSDGYVSVSLTVNGEINTFVVHRLVCFTFNENPDNKPEVHHINGIRDDNRASNLEWVSAAESRAHSWQKGLTKCHTEYHLTEEARRKISEANKAKRNTVWVNNSIDSHMVKIEDLQEYFDRGYVLGRSRFRKNMMRKENRMEHQEEPLIEITPENAKRLRIENLNTLNEIINDATVTPSTRVQAIQAREKIIKDILGNVGVSRNNMSLEDLKSFLSEDDEFYEI